MRSTWTWLPALAAMIQCVATPASARTSPTVGPKDAAVAACLADPGRTLQWLSDVRGLASRLGASTRGLDWLSEQSRTATGADLLAPEGWSRAGLRADSPLCVFVVPGGEIAVSFGVSDESRAREAVRKLVGALAPAHPDLKAAPTKAGKAKAWRLEPAGRKGVAPVGVLAFQDGVGWFVPGRGEVPMLAGGTRDFAEDLALPQGAMALAATADLQGFAARDPSGRLATVARDWVSRVRLEAVLDGSDLAVRVRGSNQGLLALVAQALRTATPPDARLAAAGRVGIGASGFVQINVPVGAILKATGGAAAAKGQPGPLPGPVGALLATLAGDVTLFTEDGLLGLTAVASVTDPAAAERALSDLVSQANAANLAVTHEPCDLAGVQGHLFRLGKPDAALRFPVFAAVRDGVLVAAMSANRVEDALAGPREHYIDRMDSPAVRDALTAGAVIVSHRSASDLLGALPQYAALVRAAASERWARFVDLFDLPAIGLELMYDGSAVGRIDPAGTTLDVHARFLGGDPMASDPRERAWGMALRARFSGRLGAWRTALLDLAQAKPDDAYGRRALRALLHPQPLTDLVLVALVAGVAGAASAAGPVEVSPAKL